MTKKDEVQELIINCLCINFAGIVLASVRVGKCRILLKAIQKHSKNYIDNPKILVLYPNIDIKTSWENECKILNYFPNITYCTFISAEKVCNLNWDYILVDESHLIGLENQMPLIGELIQRHSNTIIASGTYSNETLLAIKQHTKLELIVNYSTEQAIKDGIVSDFNIYIHQYSLDNLTKKWFGKVKKWQSTEQKECNRLSNKIKTTQGQEKFFASLNRMRFINSCDSLVNSVNNWIKQNRNERFLLFTGDEKIGLRYNLPMFNSKSESNKNLTDFQEGKINQLCLIRKGSAGVTYLNLQNILITAINSNGENLEQQIGRGLLLEEQKDSANIHIFVSTEPFQQKWLESALENFDKNKIKYINGN